MMPGRAREKKPVKLFVMNARILKRRKKPVAFSPLAREKVMTLVLVVTVVATCGFASFEIGRHFLRHPKYAVRHIEVEGNEKFSKEMIIGLSGLKKGENIFRQRIYRARERLSEFALMKHVSVSRRMPDTIVIEVQERHPRARLLGPKRVLADYSGVVLPYSSCDDPDELPLVIGVDTAGLSVGEKCLHPAMTRAMRLLRLCGNPRLSSLVEVEWIDSSEADDLRLYFREGKYTRKRCEVCVGGDDFEQRLANLTEILGSVPKEYGKKVRSVDLTLENVPVRF
jgi:hypothetical protein